MFMDGLVLNYDGIMKFIEGVGGEQKRKMWYEGPGRCWGGATFEQ